MGQYKINQIILLTEDAHLFTQVKNFVNLSGSSAAISQAESIAEITNIDNPYVLLIDKKLVNTSVKAAIDTAKAKSSNHPVIIITEKEFQDEAADLLDDGADDYITTDNMKRLMPVVKREIKSFERYIEGQKARQEIKELMNIIESAEDEIYILSENYDIKFANRKALRNLDYQEDDLEGKNFKEIAEEILELDGRNTSNRVMFHTRLCRKDGSKYPAEVVIQLAETDGKKALLAVTHDITEKESVKHHAFMLNKAIDACASSVTVTDESFKIIYANKKQINTAGKNKSFLLDKDITEEKMYESSGKEFLNALERCRKGESWVGEYQKTGFDGEEYIVLGSVSPVYTTSEKVSNVVIVEEDITERVRIKSQLLHAQKMETVGELTSGIAHDFTNMLTAIGGFASIMKRKMDKESRFYIYAEKIADITVRAKDLTKNLLTFSRKQMEAERPVSVNSLVKSVGEFLSMVIGSRIELNIKLMKEDVYIMGDPVQLEQVIINLATNARDAIEEEGKLTITTDRAMVSDPETAGGFKEYAVISVKDNGCGIDPAKQERIFEPFYTTKQAGKGTGLGLYIVSDIVSRHQGRIECFSESGAGTEFVISMPVTDEKPEEMAVETEVENLSGNITVLLVEDEKIVRESLAHALDIYGYKILEAVNGKEALEVFKEKRDEIDIVITDIVMPVMNGITAYKEMIAIKPEQKFIFTTGYVGEAHRKEGFNEEDHVVMIKPLMIKDLIKKMEEQMR